MFLLGNEEAKNDMAFERILCAVDLSTESEPVFQTAAEFALQAKRELRLLHVIEAQPVTRELPPVKSLGEVALTMEQKAVIAMQTLINSAGKNLENVTVTSEIDSGEAAQEIINHARRWKADLIVLGARGAPSLADIIAGSTAQRVTKEAPCSVLVVRSDRRKASFKDSRGAR